METLDLKENIQIETENIENNSQNVISEENSDISSETSEQLTTEPSNIEIENANTTNCLALTIQKDHKIIAVKNVFIRSIRMSWKVIVSTITLGLIKLFS